MSKILILYNNNVSNNILIYMSLLNYLLNYLFKLKCFLLVIVFVYLK